MSKRKNKSPAIGNQPAAPSRPAPHQTIPVPNSNPAKPNTDYLKNLKNSRALPLLAVVIIALLPSIYFYHKSTQAEQKLNAPSTSSLQTTAEVVKQVSRHILLPSGEQPTVATVSDASKVRNQAFFANAASGDKVLIYAQAKKAYLYRPSIDRIIEVAPLAPNKSGP